MVRLGEISYALYLVHYGIMLGFAYVRPSAPRIPDPAMYGLFWLVILAASWALWRWVEWPARSYARAWWRLHEPALSPGQWRAAGTALAAAAALILALQIATLR
jgi:peptidoglycan/LPS O-acetylase OafA/YrhL